MIASKSFDARMPAERHPYRMETRAKRIRHVRSLSGLSQEDFGKRLDVSRGAVGNWEIGKPINTEHLTLISHSFGVSMDWLANNQGVPPKKLELGFRETVPWDDFERMSDDGSPGAVFEGGRINIPDGEIPQVDAKLTMGGPAADAPTVQIPVGDGSIAAVPVLGTWKIPQNVLRRRFRGAVSAVHIVECEGDSMEPRIHDGDFVFIDTSRQTPSPPGIFALNDGHGQVLKRLEFIPNSDPPRVKIIPENPRHSTYERDLDEVLIIGRYLCRLTMD